MKKFLLKVLLFFACVVVMDLAFGLFFSYLRAHAKGGSTANCEYIANQATDDVIILGSSRATHHYVPQIIEDSLGVSCYNCGEEGNGVVLAYGRLKMLTNRYKPKLVLYEVTPRFDYGATDPNNKYLGYLRAYYDKKGIKELFEDFDDDLSFIKMLSNMYQNTGRLLPDLLDNIVLRDNNQGYEPLYGKIDVSKKKSSTKSKTDIVVDSLKLSYVEKIIQLCQAQDIPLLFMISPSVSLSENVSSYEPEITICKKYGVPCYNYLEYQPITDNTDYFQDLSHLNNEGAVAFTQMLIKEVLYKYLAKGYNNSGS